jgi:trans-aconitate 2-methyltransferase
MDWNPQLYLKYGNERTQPSIDLVARINLASPGSVIDIGCGPGNSTQVLANRWPRADIVGLDSSPAMIEKARADFPNRRWILGDAAALDENERYDLVFSNATLQWLPDHEALIPKLFSIVKDDGALAVQVPQFDRMEVSEAIGKVVQKERWRPLARGYESRFTFHDPGFYYDCLSDLAGKVDLWVTDYIHILPSHRSLVDFCRGAGLKPVLDLLPSDNDRLRFEEEVLEEVTSLYPKQSDGKVLFPFKRLFFIGYK